MNVKRIGNKMKILLVICAILLSYPVYALDYQVEKNNRIDEIATLNIGIQLQPQLFEENFTFNNQLTLHHSEYFNLLVTANVTQTADSRLIPAISLPINETSHQYGLIGKYSLTPEWQVSGGLMHSKPSLIMGNEQNNIDNVALIGTSYSF